MTERSQNVVIQLRLRSPLERFCHWYAFYRRWGVPKRKALHGALRMAAHRQPR
jgi:hypothetical protein